jgi:hypothetical protein
MNLSPPLKGSLGSGGQRANIPTTGSGGTVIDAYHPISALENYPPQNENRQRLLDNQGGWVDGANWVKPVYRAHYPYKVADATIVQSQWRSDYEWTQSFYPPSRRDLQRYQLPQKYIIGNTLVASGVWNPGNYFLGYAPSQGNTNGG